MNHYLWIEKYRPQTIDEIVIADNLRTKIKQWISENQIPNILLHGSSPGTGKTSLSRILVNALECDWIEINASNENNVETMRTKVVQFCSTVGFNPLKVVILSEADGLTNSAQFALKDVIEEYSKYTRFIFTLNNVGKIIDPIISRCQVFEFKELPKEFVKERLEYILKQEGVKYDSKVTELIVKKYYPDFRKIINYSHEKTSNGVLTVSETDLNALDFGAMLVYMFQNKSTYKDFLEVVKSQSYIDYISTMKILFDNYELYSKKGKESEVLLTISEHMYRESLVIDHDVNLMALILNIIEVNG